MRTMLSFDLTLLKQKKQTMLCLMAANFLYLLTVAVPYVGTIYLSFVAGLIMCAVNSYTVMGSLLVNPLKTNLMGANYSVCRYFPIRRSHYIFSKCMILAVLQVFMFVLITLRVWLGWIILGDALSSQQSAALVLACISMSFLISSTIMVTSYSGRAFQIGAFTVVGCISGMISAMFVQIRENGGTGSLKGWGIVTGICLGIYVICIFISNFIAKHSTT